MADVGKMIKNKNKKIKYYNDFISFMSHIEEVKEREETIQKIDINEEPQKGKNRKMYSSRDFLALKTES